MYSSETVESNIVDCLSTSYVEENVYNEELSSEEMNLPSESNLNAWNDVVLLEDSTVTDNAANVESKTIQDDIFEESESVLLPTDENKLRIDLGATAKELVKEIIQNDPEENDKFGQSAAVENVNQTKMVGQSEEIEENQAQEPDVFDLLRENEDLYLYPGFVAEPLSRYTNWRYLVFFDDGWVQYVQHEHIRVLCEDAENVWELIEEAGAKTFIEGYLREFKKKRPIVQVNCIQLVLKRLNVEQNTYFISKVERGQRIQTELGGKWYNAIVNAVDGSLVQIFFEENKRYEWIYRGSTRLFPLYRKLKHVTSVNRNEVTIEYIVIDDEKEPKLPEKLSSPSHRWCILWHGLSAYAVYGSS